MSNKLTQTAKEILTIEEDLPHRFNYRKEPHVSLDDFKIYTFEQIWDSAALGTEWQSMKSARTYVFVPIACEQKCFVYFAGRFAYMADYSQKFINDVKACNMPSIAVAKERYKNSFAR